ncbi:hypothetical protein ACE1TF_04060 [Geomicrobium sp. JSM 1781026]|uniref:hypothetical protein n=1 Tax=Geomicrobium sp. JSM 1781026 TaxID=3344580 RepID=UPI0035C1F4D1
MAYLFLIIMVLSRIYINVIVRSTEESYGHLPSELNILVQATSVLILLYFYLQYSNEIKFGVQYSFSDGYQIMLQKVLGLLLAHITYLSVLLFLVYSLYGLTYLYVGIPLSSIYWSMFLFITMYLFVPFVIYALFGVLLAVTFGRNSIGLIVLLIVWVAAGTYNRQFFHVWFGGANDLSSLFSIGPTNDFMIYFSYLGYDLGVDDALRAGAWVAFLCALVLVFTMKWLNDHRTGTIVLGVIVASVLLAVFSAFGSIQLSSKAFNGVDGDREVTYYEQLADFSSDMNYEIESYLLTLEGNRVIANLRLSELATLTPTFQLYHGYPIDNIEGGDEQVPYERHGDQVKVFLPSENVENIKVVYQLVDTAIMPYKGNRYSYPGNMAWYPKRLDDHMLSFQTADLSGTNDFKLTKDLIEEPLLNFQLKVTEDLLFTNLEATAPGVYEGSTEAVSVIRGEGEQYEYNGYTVVAPADWPNMDERIPVVVSRWEEIILQLRDIGFTDVQNVPKQLILSYPHLHRESFMTSDHMMYIAYGLEGIHDDLIFSNFERDFIQMTLPVKGNVVVYRSWLELMSHYMWEQSENIEGRERNAFVATHNSFRNPEQYDEMLYHFDNLDEEKKPSFLYEWYRLLDDMTSIDDINTLIEEFNER